MDVDEGLEGGGTGGGDEEVGAEGGGGAVATDEVGAGDGGGVGESYEEGRGGGNRGNRVGRVAVVAREAGEGRERFTEHHISTATFPLLLVSQHSDEPVLAQVSARGGASSRQIIGGGSGEVVGTAEGYTVEDEVGEEEGPPEVLFGGGGCTNFGVEFGEVGEEDLHGPRVDEVSLGVSGKVG